MSLRHALLGMLTAEPMTGYDLVKYFDGSVAFVWSAPHSQIYPELRRMEAAGLLSVDVVQRGENAQKRVYHLTEDGVAELRRWAAELLPPTPERDAHRLRAAFFEWGTYEAARRQLQEHLNHYSEFLRQRERMGADIEARAVTILQHRLQRRPEEEHAAIVAFKRFAFRGDVGRAEAEIAWANEGLKLLDELESAGVPLTGEAVAVEASKPAAPKRKPRAGRQPS